MNVSRTYAAVFGQRLALALARRDLRCTDIQDRTGIPWGVVAAIKDGRRAPTGWEVSKLIQRAGIPAGELLGSDDDEDDDT